MHRRDHITDEVFQDYIDGRLDAESTLKIAHHVTHCSRCRTEMEFWNRLNAGFHDDAPVSTPKHVLQRAFAIFDSVARRPSLKERLLAALVFDSRIQPVLAGARDLQDTAFKLLYETPIAHIDLFCEREHSGWRLTGQVLCDAYPDTGWRIDLVQEAKHLTLAADPLGEFHFVNLADGDYELHVQSVDREIVLHAIHLT